MRRAEKTKQKDRAPSASTAGSHAVHSWWSARDLGGLRDLIRRGLVLAGGRGPVAGEPADADGLGGRKAASTQCGDARAGGLGSDECVPVGEHGVGGACVPLHGERPRRAGGAQPDREASAGEPDELGQGDGARRQARVGGDLWPATRRRSRRRRSAGLRAPAAHRPRRGRKAAECCRPRASSPTRRASSHDARVCPSALVATRVGPGVRQPPWHEYGQGDSADAQCGGGREQQPATSTRRGRQPRRPEEARSAPGPRRAPIRGPRRGADRLVSRTFR